LPRDDKRHALNFFSYLIIKL